MGDNSKEACGRCSMTSVVDMTEAEDRDPFAGERIEVPESELQKASLPAVYLGRLKRRLNGIATRLTYGARR